MKKVMFFVMVGALILSTVPAFCGEEGKDTTVKYVKVFGSVAALEPQGTDTVMAVTLTEKMSDGAESVSVILNEWTRVVREYEDLLIADLQVGQSIMVVYETNDQGGKEAVTVSLE